MRRIFSLSIAAAVSLAFALTAHAERRPRYGGVLRIEIRAAVAAIDSTDWPFPALVPTPGVESPFRLTNWKAGESAVFAANENYAGPRPFLNGIEVRMGRSLSQQLLDFEVGQADVIELVPPSVKQARQRGAIVAQTRPSDLLVLVSGPKGPVHPGIESVISLSIDRTAIHNVILQREGEITGALLPQWLSGYAFLFPVARDLAAARIGVGVTHVRFSYDRDDPVIRAIAERVAVNVMEAGVILHPVDAANSELRLLRLPIESADPSVALSRLAAALNRRLVTGSDDYETERTLIHDAFLIPLFHLPRVYQLSPRVKRWPGAADSLADTWLAGAAP